MRREPGDVIDDGGEHAGDYVDDYLAVFDQILSHNITPTYEDTTKNRGCPKIRAAIFFVPNDANNSNKNSMIFSVSIVIFLLL